MSLPQEPVCEPAEGQAGFLRCAAALAAGARLQLTLLSQNLDRRTYGDEAFIEPLTRFLLSSARARLRVLVRHPGQAMLKGHRLVELGRQLSSRVEFRELPPERQLIEREYLIADEAALLIRESPQELLARYYPQAPLLAREQLREFETLWQESPSAMEFRDLRI
ncbi:MAG: hypothetical protein E6R07_11960 [Nevskiaceae bacterium]|nr:MAG: hypothetical protein E6R07_11960 [Nevskiaceae bacterium]